MIGSRIPRKKVVDTITVVALAVAVVRMHGLGALLLTGTTVVPWLGAGGGLGLALAFSWAAPRRELSVFARAGALAIFACALAWNIVDSWRANREQQYSLQARDDDSIGTLAAEDPGAAFEQLCVFSRIKPYLSGRHVLLVDRLLATMAESSGSRLSDAKVVPRASGLSDSDHRRLLGAAHALGRAMGHGWWLIPPTEGDSTLVEVAAGDSRILVPSSRLQAPRPSASDEAVEAK